MKKPCVLIVRKLWGCVHAHVCTVLNVICQVECSFLHVLNHTDVRASQVAQTVKNPPAMRETWVLTLG